MSDLFRRMYYLLHRRQLEQELQNDMEVHREMLGQHTKDFGNPLRLQEQAHEAWGWSWFDRLAQDIRYGFRMLYKNPGFTLVSLLALALGIGVNTALFSVVYGVLLKPLPYAQGQELVVLRQDFPKASEADVPFSVKEIADYRTQTHSLAQLEEYHQMSFILLDGQEPSQVRTGVVSAHFFDLLGIQPYMGRLFNDGDETPTSDAVLVLSYPYWKTRYGGDRSIIGRRFRMNDKVHTVIGVLPPVPQYPRENDVYMTTVACPFRSDPMMMSGRDHHMMRLFGRLKPGESLQSGMNDVALIASRLEKEYPDSYPNTSGYAASMDGLQSRLTKEVRPMLLVLVGTAGLVLLIACANVANLALARMVRREQEFAVRATLGASRKRLLRQLLTESTMLSLAGGALGLWLASGCLALLVGFVGRFTTRAAEVSMSTPVLLFTLVLSVLTGLAFGSIPAFSQRLDLVHSLKEGSNSSSRSSRHRMRNLLVMGQVAISFMLLIGAGLMIRSFIKLQQVNAGYDSDRVLTANVPFNFTKYKQAKDVINFFDGVFRKLQGSQGVRLVAANSAAPLAPARPSHDAFTIEGRPVIDKESQPRADSNSATPDTFSVLGIPLIRGRFFTAGDTADKPPVVIISQSLARHYFPNESPLGKRISGDQGKHWASIVGIVGDIAQYGLDKEPVDTVYIPSTLNTNLNTLLVKTSDDPLNHVRQLREAVLSVDPEQPITDVKTLDQLRGDTLAAIRLTSLLLALFATLALTIAATGLSGVTALLVSQRTREIGIRMALGAQRGNVLWMVLMQSLRVILIGLAVGVAVAIAQFMQTLLFKMPAVDTLTFAGVALVLLVVALLASYIPARRVTRVNPLIALRSE